MKKLKEMLISTRGEGYIDVVVSVLVSTMILVLAINVFTFLGLKQDMDYFARELIFSATANGSTAGEADTRYAELAAETGLEPQVAWTASYFDQTDQSVQYGDTITVTLTFTTEVKGFGSISIPITLTAKHSGLSQRYWK